MATKKTTLYTQQGFKALKDELDYLKNVKREEVKRDLSTARSFGDLSENSEYDEARNEQAKTEARIKELEELINNAEIVDESKIDTSVVGVGSTVKLYFIDGLPNEKDEDGSILIYASYINEKKHGNKLMNVDDDDAFGTIEGMLVTLTGIARGYTDESYIS